MACRRFLHSAGCLSSTLTIIFLAHKLSVWDHLTSLLVLWLLVLLCHIQDIIVISHVLVFSYFLLQELWLEISYSSPQSISACCSEELDEGSVVSPTLLKRLPFFHCIESVQRSLWRGSFWVFYSIVLNLPCSYGSLVSLVISASLCNVLRSGSVMIPASFFFPRLCTLGIPCGSVWVLGVFFCFYKRQV